MSAGQSPSISSSSLRWRGVSPFTVLEELTRHRSRSLLALTRPYFGHRQHQIEDLGRVDARRRIDQHLANGNIPITQPLP